MTQPADAAGRESAGRGPGRTLACCLLVAALITAASLWLRVRVPIPVGISYFDDILFLRTAQHLADGSWLGPFDNLTLAKGPAYPAFIAVTHSIGLPLKAGEQLTYLLAAACVAGGVWVTTQRLLVATSVYCLLALDPINFNSQSAELIRDSWHAALGLLFPAAVFLALSMALRRAPVMLVIVVAAGAGVAGATYWLCREEGVTILPTIAIIALGLPLLRLRIWWRRPKTERFSGPSRTTMLRYGLAAVLMVATFVGPLLAVGVMNDRHYGTALTNDVGSGEFARMYADWTRVDGGSTQNLVPIDFTQRSALYQVSAAARELQPHLEDTASVWNQLACGGRPECPFPGAFMTWAIRDAAAQAGHFDSESNAQAFFSRLDDEIVAGCDNGLLGCTRALPAPVQPLLRADPAALLSSFGTIVGRVELSVDLFDEPAQYWTDPLDRRPATVAIVNGVPQDGPSAQAQFAAFSQTQLPYEVLDVVYRVLIPLLTLLALLSLTIGWWIIGCSRPLLVLAAALAVGFLVRSLLLALINTVEYDAMIARYQLASHLLLFGAAIVGSVALLDEALDRRWWSRPRADRLLRVDRRDLV